MSRAFTIAVIGALSGSPAYADSVRPESEQPPAVMQRGVPQGTRAVTPVFGQLLSYSMPAGFVPAFESAKGGFYIQEAVLAGETVEHWTQMVTLTGAKGLAALPSVTPERFASLIAGGFQRGCPTSFSFAPLGETKLGKYEAFISVIGCGTAKPVGDPYSETMLLVAIKGEQDLYSVQWAERAGPDKTSIAVDQDRWRERLSRLMPIKLCPRVTGESAPYPSCE